MLLRGGEQPHKGPVSRGLRSKKVAHQASVFSVFFLKLISKAKDGEDDGAL
jgi:hypothetical protein